MAMTPDRRRFINAAAGLLSAPALAPIAQAAAPAGRALVNVADLGAIGDGAFHPLSERFATLVEAQAVFPSAKSLADSLDGAAIQTAIDTADRRGRRIQAGGHVLLPAGRYPLSRSLRLPNGVVLEGQGAGVTIIDNQNRPLAAPLVVNDDADTARLTLRHLSLHGGSHGVHIAVGGSVDGVLLEGVSFQLQSDKNFECNKLLQIAAFRHCTFGQAPFGVFVGAWTSNVVLFDQCSFENHSHAHLYLRGAECINILGGRFEGGGRPGGDQATLDLEAAAAINIRGVYFENTHPILLRERRSRNGVVFEGCHFSGALGEKGLIPYRFDSDGIVGFGSNDWGLPTPGPSRAAMFGTNDNLSTDGRLYLVRSATAHHIRSESVRISDGLTRDVLILRFQGAGEGPVLVGVLTFTIIRSGDDGAPVVSTYRQELSAAAKHGAVRIRPAPAAPGAPRIQIRAMGGLAAMTIQIPAGLPGYLRWTFEADVTGGNGTDWMTVDLG